MHWRSRPSSGADMHCRRSRRPAHRAFESAECPLRVAHIGPPVGPFSGSPAGVARTAPRSANWRRRGITAAAPTASDVRGLRTAPRYRESAPARGVRGAIRRLVLLRLLLAVFGLGRLLRKAALGLRVRLAGLRALLVGLVGPVLRGFAMATSSLRAPAGPTQPVRRPRFCSEPGRSSARTAPGTVSTRHCQASTETPPSSITYDSPTLGARVGAVSAVVGSVQVSGPP